MSETIVIPGWRERRPQTANGKSPGKAARVSEAGRDQREIAGKAARVYEAGSDHRVV